MTNKQRLISLLGFAPPADAIDGELIDVGITGSEDYTTANIVPIKRAAIKLFELLLTTADTYNVDWNKIAYDRKAVLDRIKILKAEIGEADDTQPKITGKHVW